MAELPRAIDSISFVFDLVGQMVLQLTKLNHPKYFQNILNFATGPCYRFIWNGEFLNFGVHFRNVSR